MKRERIIAEVESVEEAKKVEETVKTGYAEPSIETLVSWMGVEEDLANSYDRLAANQGTAPAKGVFQKLSQESRGNIGRLSELRKSFEELDRARIERIRLLESLKP